MFKFSGWKYTCNSYDQYISPLSSLVSSVSKSSIHESPLLISNQKSGNFSYEASIVMMQTQLHFLSLLIHISIPGLMRYYKLSFLQNCLDLLILVPLLTSFSNIQMSYYIFLARYIFYKLVRMSYYNFLARMQPGRK